MMASGREPGGGAIVLSDVFTASAAKRVSPRHLAGSNPNHEETGMAEANPSIQQTATTAHTRNGWGRPRYESGSLLLFFIPGSHNCGCTATAWCARNLNPMDEWRIDRAKVVT